MKVIKFIFNCILSFLLIFALCASMFLNIIKNKLLDKDYIISKMHDLKYFDQISEEINNEFDNYKYQSGLPEDTLEHLFDKEIIESDIISVVDYIYGGAEVTESSETIKSNLDSRINEYIASQEIQLNEQGKENIEKYEEIIVEAYQKNIHSSSIIYKPLRNTVNETQNVYEKIKVYPIIVLIAIIILIILLNFKNLLYAINFIGISSLSLGIILEISIYYVNSIIKIDSIMLFNKSVTSLMINMIKEIFFTIQDNGMLVIFCGVVSILISNILNSINKKGKNTN